MPPRRTSLQVDVSRVLYAVYICQYVCRVVDRVWIHVQVGQGMPHQQAQYLASSIRFPDKNKEKAHAWRDLSEKRALSARRLFFVDGGSIN